MNEPIQEFEHTASSNHFLIQLQNIRVSLGGKTILSQIDWQLKPHENWAFLGGNGAGKTTLIRLIRGEIWPDPNSQGKRIYRLDGGDTQTTPIGVRERIPVVSAELQDSYLRNQWNLSSENVVFTGYTNSVWLFHKPDLQQRETAWQIMDSLGVLHLRERSFLELSRGESRKILMARALVTHPRIMVLDEFCNELDIATRQNLSAVMESIAQQGTQLIYITHRLEELIPSISHILILEKGRIIRQGKREHIQIENDRKTMKPVSFSIDRGFRNPNSLQNRLPKKTLISEQSADLESFYFFQIENTDVYRKDKRVLHQLTWRMKNHENWAVLGNNGSGKTSFLSLLYGNLHPALGGQMHRFGIPDGEVSVWEIRRKMGFLSAHLQADYEYNLTGDETIQSGFFSSVGLWDEVSEEMKEAARYWIAFFGLEDLAEQTIHTLSYGQLRKILLARALVNTPHVLLLDEPCNGLDRESKAQFLEMLQALSSTRTRLIFVTHHPEELIPSISHAIVLKDGFIQAQGQIEEVPFNTQDERYEKA